MRPSHCAWAARDGVVRSDLPTEAPTTDVPSALVRRGSQTIGDAAHDRHRIPQGQAFCQGGRRGDRGPISPAQITCSPSPNWVLRTASAAYGNGQYGGELAAAHACVRAWNTHASTHKHRGAALRVAMVRLCWWDVQGRATVEEAVGP